MIRRIEHRKIFLDQQDYGALWPFSLREIRRNNSARDAFDLIRRGFSPRLHEEALESRRFFNDYLQTYVERDVHTLIQLRDLIACDLQQKSHDHNRS